MWMDVILMQTDVNLPIQQRIHQLPIGLEKERGIRNPHIRKQNRLKIVFIIRTA